MPRTIDSAAAQRMDVAGRLAGGIAHDFSNLLTAILGHADLLSDAIAADDPRQDDVAGIRAAAQQAAVLTQRLLAFSQSQALHASIVDVNEVIAGMRGALARILGDRVDLVTCATPDLWQIRTDPAHVEQILVTLVVNARDAMPAGGTLTLRTSNVAVDARRASEHGAKAGAYVEIVVGDNGVGIPREVQQHLFEPFFSTKGHHRGAGLGLAMVYGLVVQSGGFVVVDSQLGEGARFAIYLPRAIEPRDDDAVARTTSRRPRRHRPSRTATVLLVEDEPSVRALMADVLRRDGYDVLTAAGGDDAIRLVRRRADPIDLLVADVVMPVTGGVAVAEAVREQQPNARVLFVSGCVTRAPSEPAGDGPPACFLRKPFTPAAFAEKVRGVLALA